MAITVSREEMQQEALSRAVSGQTMSNYPDIFRGFMAKGVPESEIRPRENVFTYHAWRALKRQVRRGEHGVRICTYVTTERKEKDPETGEEKTRPASMPHWTTVFHVSQTDPIPDGASGKCRKPTGYFRPDRSDLDYEDRCREACGL